MILNHTSNPNVFALAADRASNPELMKKCSKLLRTIRFLEVDGTIRDKLYERACDAPLKPKQTHLIRRQSCKQPLPPMN